MTTPPSETLGYAHPPPPRENLLRGADAQWLRTLGRGCVILAIASVGSCVVFLQMPAAYFASYIFPFSLMPAYLAAHVLLAFGALLGAFPRRTDAGGTGEDSAGVSRTIALAGLGVVLAADLIAVLAQNPTVAHPSGAVMEVGYRAGPVAGLVGVLALMRHLRHRAREMG